MFFQYLTSAYSSFLNGDDDTYQELEEELVSNFEGELFSFQLS